MLESINETIEVLTVFAPGKVSPLRFRWRNKVIKVSQVTGKWMRNEGETRLHYYSILADTSDYFELCFDATNLKWVLSKVWLAG